MSVEDVGKCAYGIFKRGASVAGQRFGVAGEWVSGQDMAAKMGRAIGQTINFFDVPFDMFRGFGFPGAEDIGNMFQVQAIMGDEFLNARSPTLSRELNPALLDFDGWLAKHAKDIPVQ